MYDNKNKMEVEMDDLEKARQLLRVLEIKNSKSKVENALRILCIEELLDDTRRRVKENGF